MLRFAISTIVLKHKRALAGIIIFSIGKWTTICKVEIISHILDIEIPKNNDRNIFIDTVAFSALLEASAKAFNALVAALKLNLSIYHHQVLKVELNAEFYNWGLLLLSCQSLRRNTFPWSRLPKYQATTLWL